MLLVCDYGYLIGNTCTINEQIEIMAGHMLNNFITDIKNSGIFLLLQMKQGTFQEMNSLLFAYIGLTITIWSMKI